MDASPTGPASSVLLADPHADSETHSANRRPPSRERIIRVFTLSCLCPKRSAATGARLPVGANCSILARADAAIGLPAQDPTKSMTSRALVIFAACAFLGCGGDGTHLTRDDLVDPEKCKTCHAD